MLMNMKLASCCCKNASLKMDKWRLIGSNTSKLAATWL
jgi:hypothetical protein